MPDVGDRVSVASKSGPRLGVVVSTSGSLLRVRWESGDETSLIPGPGALTVVGKTRKRSPGVAKAANAAKVKPGRASAATAKRAPSKNKAAPKKSAAATPVKSASKSIHKKAAAAKSPQKGKAPPAKKPVRKAR